MASGVILNLISRIIFIAGSFSLHVYLARFLGPDKYGVFGVTIAIITMSFVFLNNGVRQIVSTSSARFPESAGFFLKKGLIVQLIVAVCLGLFVIVFSKKIALSFNDESLVRPLYLSGVIIVVQSVYFIYAGVLNGLKKFGKENIIISTYSFIRPFAAILLVYLGFEIIGALTGFLIASIIAALTGMILTKGLDKKRIGDFNIKQLLKKSIPVMIIFGSITLIMNADLLAVKYLLKNSSFSGYYTSASSISKLIYWFLFAFASALLPYVSKSFHSQNYDDTRKYVVGILRYSMLLTSPAVVLISVYSEDIITLVYGTDYSNAGNILSVLIFGLFGLSMMAILGNALIGIEKVGIMAKYAITGAISSILLNMLLVPHMGCLGGSVSTTVSSVVVAILSYATLARNLKINININSVMRVVFSLTAILMISINVKGKCYPFMISFTLLYLTFFIVLYALKEITKKDIVIITDSFNSLVNKKRSKKLNSPKTQEPI